MTRRRAWVVDSDCGAKIAQLAIDFGVVRNRDYKHVRRLEIAIENAVFMQKRHGARGIEHHFELERGSDVSFADQPAHRATFQQFSTKTKFASNMRRSDKADNIWIADKILNLRI